MGRPLHFKLIKSAAGTYPLPPTNERRNLYNTMPTHPCGPHRIPRFGPLPIPRFPTPVCPYLIHTHRPCFPQEQGAASASVASTLLACTNVADPIIFPASNRSTHRQTRAMPTQPWSRGLLLAARHLTLLPLLLAGPAQGGPALPWAPTPEAEGFDAGILQDIQPAVQRLVDAKTIPGAAVLGARHGRLVLNVTAGQGAFASGGEAGPPIFRLFSMSKPVVAVLALALIDEGLLGLDDPIGQHLPELATPDVYQGKNDLGGWVTAPAPRCATVRELMTHTAGFSYGFNPQDHPVDRAYALAGFADLRETQEGGSDAFIRTLAAIPLVAAPNTTWRYSVSYDVLGVLLERVTQKPLDALLREYVTGPLKLLDTDFFVPLDKAHRLPAVDVKLSKLVPAGWVVREEGELRPLTCHAIYLTAPSAFLPFP
jgi:CubicO group peptidase (beta-lactamase class C family)